MTPDFYRGVRKTVGVGTGKGKNKGVVAENL